MTTCDFFTVATVSYTEQALTTIVSACRKGDFARAHLFAIDAKPEAVKGLSESFRRDGLDISVFGPENLEGEHRALFLRCFEYYNAIELSCLAKYLGAAHVLASSATAGRCVYADSDILFFSDPAAVIGEMGNKAILLTPHQFGPSNDAAEHDYLLHGWINAGFFVLNKECAEVDLLLEWLIDRISKRGFLAPSLGISCDQTWVSLLPALFGGSVAICRDPGCNVAYWNLQERELGHTENGYSANGQPLVFFHFSGFSGAWPSQLSTHVASPLRQGSILLQICALYRHRLDEFTGRYKTAAETLSWCNADIRQRILIGSRLNDVNIDSPTTSRGFFTRLGAKLDERLQSLRMKRGK